MFFQNVIKLFIIISVVNCAQVPKPPETTTPMNPSPTTNEVQICVDLTPNYMPARYGLTQTLVCSATICGNNVDDNKSIEFYQPVFDWNSQLGHIMVVNGTCDYAKSKCWHAIDIDTNYFIDEMLDNGLNEMQFSCFVSDSFATGFGDSLQYETGSDFSYFKLFKGHRIGDNCDTDNECGDNMFCLRSSKGTGTTCQCSVDFLTGVQYVQVMDQNYQEMVCVPPVGLNDSCIYDQQCQAFDSNSVCAQESYSDSNYGKCVCSSDTVYYKDSCQSVSKGTKPPVVWWIFTTDYNDNSNSDTFRFLSLRNATYVMAVLAIFLPILLIFVSLLILCYRRIYRERDRQNLVKTMFPTPRLRINDLCDIKKEKSDDKYNLVKNDQLEKNMA